MSVGIRARKRHGFSLRFEARALELKVEDHGKGFVSVQDKQA